MYLKDFLQSLDFLTRDVPHNWPGVEDAIYLGYEFVNNIKNRSNQDIPECADIVITYIKIPSLQVGYHDVTTELNYIKKLDAEQLDEKFYKISIEMASAIILEALWLFDFISDLPSNKKFLEIYDGGVLKLHALLNNGLEEDGEPVLYSFATPLEKDIFFSQSIFFIKKYINARLLNYEVEISPSFEINFIELLTKQSMVYIHTSNLYRSKSVTSYDNPELELLIQQLGLFTFIQCNDD